MSKLYELLGKPEAIKGLFGIEIEAEGKGMRGVFTDLWQTEDDPSLRGEYPHSRAEFVLNKPIDLKQVKPAVKQLAEELKEAKLKFSFRTSTHVHLNMQECTVPELFATIYTYLLLEEPLLNYCGDVRKCNRFCLRLQDAEGLVEALKKIFSTGSPFQFQRDMIRYASINLEALKKYGSLEFRGMRGTMDEAIIFNWCSMLNKIKTYAVAKGDVEDVHQEFRDLGANQFIEKVLGKPLTRLLGKDFEKEINTSYSLSIELPYAYKAYKDAPKPVAPIAPKIDLHIDLAAAHAAVRRAIIRQGDPAPPPIRAGNLPNPGDYENFEEWEAAMEANRAEREAQW